MGENGHIMRKLYYFENFGANYFLAKTTLIVKLSFYKLEVVFKIFSTEIDKNGKIKIYDRAMPNFH